MHAGDVSAKVQYSEAEHTFVAITIVINVVVVIIVSIGTIPLSIAVVIVVVATVRTPTPSSAPWHGELCTCLEAEWCAVCAGVCGILAPKVGSLRKRRKRR